MHVLNAGSTSRRFGRFDGVDEGRNAASAGIISTNASRVTVRVIRPDEELMIARSAERVRGRRTIRSRSPQRLRTANEPPGTSGRPETVLAPGRKGIDHRR